MGRNFEHLLLSIDASLVVPENVELQAAGFDPHDGAVFGHQLNRTMRLKELTSKFLSSRKIGRKNCVCQRPQPNPTQLPTGQLAKNRARTCVVGPDIAPATVTPIRCTLSVESGIGV